MPSRTEKQTPANPVFSRCPRCRYNLRGLPAKHACPECGLHFDPGCAIFPVHNPRQVLLVWAAILGGGWISLKKLPHVINASQSSFSDLFVGFAGLVWLTLALIGAFWFARRYRQGFLVAIASDGLILRLPNTPTDLIPWSQINSVQRKPLPATKPQVVRIYLEPRNKRLDLGGVANVFPTPAEAEQFVKTVQSRLQANSATQKPDSPDWAQCRTKQTIHLSTTPRTGRYRSYSPPRPG